MKWGHRLGTNASACPQQSNDDLDPATWHAFTQSSSDDFQSNNIVFACPPACAHNTVFQFPYMHPNVPAGTPPLSPSDASEHCHAAAWGLRLETPLSFPGGAGDFPQLPGRCGRPPAASRARLETSRSFPGGARDFPQLPGWGSRLPAASRVGYMTWV